MKNKNQIKRLVVALDVLNASRLAGHEQCRDAIVQLANTLKDLANNGIAYHRLMPAACRQMYDICKTYYSGMPIEAPPSDDPMECEAWFIKAYYDFNAHTSVNIEQQPPEPLSNVFSDLLMELGQFIARQRALIVLSKNNFPRNFVVIRRIVDRAFKEVFLWHNKQWWMFFSFNCHRLDEVMAEYHKARVLDRMKLIAAHGGFDWDGFVKHIAANTPTIIKDVSADNGETIEAAYTIVLVRFACWDKPTPVFIGFDDLEITA
ncbi:MAG: hypothetical protein D6712_21065 [Chloroflexi bacterium]|nr:MAG: hypothetical protein D6712_21065 [Chloroflexota bacterium]